MSKRRLVVLVLFALPIAAAVACYGATQLSVELSTDVPCDGTVSTAIYTGLPPAGAPVAVTSGCKRADEIGSIVLVPSGDRDGRSTVKAVLARGQDPAQCDAHPAACIVATRSFSFVKHSSRRLPIRLLGECLGKVCGDGLTCGPGGVCVSDAVACSGDECRLPVESEAPDAGPDPAPVEAGPADAAADADVGPTCLGPNGDGTLVKVGGAMPGALEAAEGAGTFYYLDPASRKTVSPPISSVTADGKLGTITTLPGATPSLIALEASGLRWAVLSQSFVGPAAHAWVTTPLGKVDLGFVNGALFTDVAWSPNDPTLYVVSPERVGRIVIGVDAGATVTPDFAGAGGDRIAVDEDVIYVANAQSLYVIDRASSVADKKGLLPDGARPVQFARQGNKVVAAGLEGTTRRIVRLRGTDTPESIVNPTTEVVSLTADLTSVYWTDGKTIWRLPTNGAFPTTGSVEQIFTMADGSKIDHLAAGAGCVYFWNESSDATTATLRSIPASGVKP